MYSVFVFFATFQAIGASSRVLLPFLPTDDAIRVSDVISKRLGTDSTGVKRPRSVNNVMSILTLLWPQVVGPIENGVIKEEDYDAVPKTQLESKLDQIRERSKTELATRKHIREMLNTGMSPAQLGIHQLHTLHQDLGVFFGHHPHHPPELIHNNIANDHHQNIIFHPIEVHPMQEWFPENWPFGPDHHPGKGEALKKPNLLLDWFPANWPFGLNHQLGSLNASKKLDAPKNPLQDWFPANWPFGPNHHSVKSVETKSENTTKPDQSSVGVKMTDEVNVTEKQIPETKSVQDNPVEKFTREETVKPINSHAEFLQRERYRPNFDYGYAQYPPEFYPGEYYNVFDGRSPYKWA